MATGVALDAAAIIGVWTALNTAGALNVLLESWLCAVGLMIVPWYVHVVALPAIFGITGAPKLTSPALLIRGFMFIAVAAVLIPWLGFTAFLFLGFFLALIQRSGAAGFPAAPHTWVERLPDEICVLLIAAVVGAAVGALLHIVRADDLISHPGSPHKPSARSDIIGGAIAAFLLFGGVYVALPLGLFYRSVDVPVHLTGNLAVAPQLLPSALIVAVAMLPHLFMMGKDLLYPDRRSINPALSLSHSDQRKG